jgi:hypothetical protein
VKHPTAPPNSITCVYVHEVKIGNVKSFGEASHAAHIDFERPGGRFAGWTVVAGRNGAGKSTFLQAIAVSLGGQEAARTLQESWAGWIHHGAHYATIATRVRYSPDHDKFFETGRLPKESFWTGLRWDVSETGPEPTLSAHRETSHTTTRTAQRGPWSDNPSGWLVAGYGPFRRLSSAASDAQRLMVGPGHVSRLVSLFREDASLAESVRWLQDIYLRRLEERPGWAELESIVLRLLDDGLLPAEMKVRRVDSDGLWVEHAGVELPLRNLSDGYRTVAALVLDIVRHLYSTYGALEVTQTADGLALDYPGVVLIDEIDAHLHVSWQQVIGFWLKTRFPSIQFIVSTHSPFICQAADRRGLIRLPAPGENRVAEHVSEQLFIDVVNGSADEATLTELFGLEKTHSEQSEALRQQVAFLEAKILRGEADRAERQRFQQLQLLVPRSGLSSVDRAARVLGVEIGSSEQ